MKMKKYYKQTRMEYKKNNEQQIKSMDQITFMKSISTTNEKLE